ncbi:TM0106 family RecB-like putative nuclease [Rhizobium sp. SG741]|uniref:TM0106 family RecB-like putative nuclease n=1 Tax=Rhizobium sp. SG741 TaxID=2587114 RepID=UPI0014476839|nr:TM0106 family RecB-like putative nuclease [Rhizobium sp. SG741]NKJ07907.1 uncharacterized protein [Rhizobium sp. SG741]
MKKVPSGFQLTASDLVGHLNCARLTALDIKVASGELAKPHVWDPMLEILRERGFRHEQEFVDHLKSTGLSCQSIEGVDISDANVAATVEAMKAGIDVIIQGALRHGYWAGRADILRRVAKPGGFSEWSYEVIDTKLARETKGGTVLQLCLYSDLLAETQGCQPDYAYVVAPWSDFEPERFRMADYLAYFRRSKAAMELAIRSDPASEPYPDPNIHCDICRWSEGCDKRRRDDDHLSFVAGITGNQIVELGEHGISTLQALAETPLPMPWKPQRGSVQSFEKVREQARLQAEARTEGGIPKYELLPVQSEFGLCALPVPDPGDIFFDLEGDPFVGEHGLEFLFGYHYRNRDGSSSYVGDWAFDRTSERAAFERFVDFVMERRAEYPRLHIYHFAPYEPAALKRLMGRYASREDQIDVLLRGLVLIDLYSVVRNALRASVESYSIKRLEQFYDYTRQVELRAANLALSAFHAGLELNDVASITEADKVVVKGYNQDDCVSTEALRDWLEERRTELVQRGQDVPRPAPGQDAPSDEISEQQKRVSELVERLTAGIPVDPEKRDNTQQGQWLLANILDWHRREEKAGWWEKFRLQDLSVEELIDEKSALSGLTFIEAVLGSGRIPTHRYTFHEQETDILPGKSLHLPGGGKWGSVAAISTADRTIDVKKIGATAETHADATFAHDMIQAKEQAACLLRIGSHVAEVGFAKDERYKAALDLLSLTPADLCGQMIQNHGETTLDAATRIARNMQSGVLPIQGPPGTGKSFTGARMICQFVKDGKKVGITANSHKVIRNLIDKVIEASKELNIQVRCVQKPESGNKEDDTDDLVFARDNKDVFSALGSGDCHVAGGTSFLWAREDAEDVLDVLFVDEAAQMSLANVLAVSHVAKRLILLGDPQQLDQPTQGTHPDGTGVSALQHILAGKQTIGSDKGLFLEETWRMHPDICAFDSEMFYDSKLHSVPGCRMQVIVSDDRISGSGLRYLSVPHVGNNNVSVEEACAIKELVDHILDTETKWIDRHGVTRSVTLEDILVITPYNAQVLEIQKGLPNARVGTVDKFQGQEAPIAIYSMATSSSAEAPRGMEFLYSSNRLNVAISRAKCIAILVASPLVFDTECRTPRQMQLANAFCRYAELASEV